MDAKEFLLKEAISRTDTTGEIKDFLLKEAVSRTDNVDAKEYLLKEAETRIDNSTFDIKDYLLGDAILRLDALNKTADMAVTPSGSQFSSATNVEVQDFPYEEHPRINKTRAIISESFGSLLKQRIQAGGKRIRINYEDFAGEKYPFYIRLAYDKHILPIENREEINEDLRDLSPGLDTLMGRFEQKTLRKQINPKTFVDLKGPAPFLYYNGTNCEVQNDEAMKEWALSMNTILMSSGQNDFVSQNPALRTYWTQMLQRMQGGEVPELYKSFNWRAAGTAPQQSIEDVNSVTDIRRLFMSIHFAETDAKQEGGTKTLYQKDALLAKEKKREWEKFVIDQLVSEEEAKQEGSENKDADKARVVALKRAKDISESVWSVYGEIPPEERDITQPNPGETAPRLYRRNVSQPYNQVMNHDALRLLLKFLKVPQLRWMAGPKARSNGLDMGHIYPPVEYDKEKEEYSLDFKRANMGLDFMKINLGHLIGNGQVVQQTARDIDGIYANLVKKQGRHPVMSSHTGADNLLFFLQQLPSMDVSTGEVQGKGLSRAFVDQIKIKHGKDANSVINLAALLLKNNANRDDADVLNGISDLYTFLTSGNAYKLAKILDVVRYTTAKHSPNTIYNEWADKLWSGKKKNIGKLDTRSPYKFYDHGYTSGGESGQFMLAVTYANNVDIEDIAGSDQSNIDALQQTTKGSPKINVEQVRKTLHPQQVPEGEFPVMPGAQAPTIEGRQAKISPELSFVVLQGGEHEEGDMLKRTIPDLAFSTFEDALSNFQSKYPQAEEFVDNGLHFIRVRMNSAVEKIKQAILKAVEIVQKQTGIQFIDETGQDIGTAAQKAGEQIQQMEQEVQTEMPGYYKQETPLAPEEMQVQEITQPPAEQIIEQAPQQPVPPVQVPPSRDSTKRRGELTTPLPDVQATTVDRLVKLADKFDKEGYITISNKIDLLLAKLKG